MEPPGGENEKEREQTSILSLEKSSELNKKGWIGRLTVSCKRLRLHIRLTQIVYAYQFLIASGYQMAAILVECYRFDNVFVFETVQFFTVGCVPDFACKNKADKLCQLSDNLSDVLNVLTRKIGGSSRCQRGRFVQCHTPYGTLMALECAHPVAGVTLP